jgi:hypothetical protein
MYGMIPCCVLRLVADMIIMDSSAFLLRASHHGIDAGSLGGVGVFRYRVRANNTLMRSGSGGS